MPQPLDDIGSLPDNLENLFQPLLPAFLSRENLHIEALAAGNALGNMDLGMVRGGHGFEGDDRPESLAGLSEMPNPLLSAIVDAPRPGADMRALLAGLFAGSAGETSRNVGPQEQVSEGALPSKNAAKDAGVQALLQSVVAQITSDLSQAVERLTEPVNDLKQALHAAQSPPPPSEAKRPEPDLGRWLEEVKG